MRIIEGKITRPQKVVLYGPEGIGKSTFASQFPDPLFIDTEGSTIHLDVKRLDAPTSWQMLFDQIKWVRDNKPCKTLVIDTADWAEDLATKKICQQFNLDGIEGLGYGKGFTYLEEEFGRMLNLLSDVIEAGMNVVVLAHTTIRKFERPDEMGAYDRWELKLQKKTAPLLKEWSDMLLFANYKVHVINVTPGNAKAGQGKYKAQGGKRVMYSLHTPSWDAKNRHDLPEEMDLSFDAIKHIIPDIQNVQEKSTASAPVEKVSKPESMAPDDMVSLPFDFGDEPGEKTEMLVNHKQLNDLLVINNVTPEQIQTVVGDKGYFPSDMPINDYPNDFIEQVLIAAWDQVFALIK